MTRQNDQTTQQDVHLLNMIMKSKEKKTTMNTANLETNKPDLNWEEDCNDIPFILCTPTKNEDDAAAAQAQDTTADEKDTPNPMTFFLKPRR